MYGRALHCKRNQLWRLMAGLLFITFLFAFPVRVAASHTTAAPAAMEGIDVMLLIDTSGSMRYSDSRRVALESAKMFVDLLETNSSRIGVIGFSDKLQGVIPLTPIQHPEDKEHIKNTISSFVYNGYTDIGLALLEAAQAMQADTVNSPMIVLLTDGFIQINTRKTGRTVEESHNDVLAALEQLGGHVPVYTIGLDNEDSVDTALLQTISDATAAQTYIAGEAAGLPQIYNEIIADHLHSSLSEAASFAADSKDFTEVPFTVTGPYVAEADIIMLSGRSLTEVTVQNPSGETVPFDGVRCTLASSKQYSIIKIAAPEEGEWLVGVKGANNDAVKVNVMYTYHMGITLSLSQEGVFNPPFNPRLPVMAHAEFVAANRQAQGDALYADMKAELRVYDPDMKLLTAIPMARTDKGFSGSFQPREQEEVIFAVHAAHTHFSKSSAFYPVRFEAVPEEAAVDGTAAGDAASGDTTHDGTGETSAAVESTTDPSDTASVTDAPSASDKSSGQLSEQLSDELSDELSDKLSDKGSFTIPWRALGLLSIGLAVAALLFFGGKPAMAAIRKIMKPAEFDGYLAVRAMTQDGVYTILDTPDLRGYKGSVALDDFLSAQLSGIGAKILLVPVDLDGIVLSPGQKNNRPVILLSNKSGCEISDDEDNILTQKKILWRESKRLTFSDVNSETFAKIEITFEGSERYG